MNVKQFLGLIGQSRPFQDFKRDVRNNPTGYYYLSGLTASAPAVYASEFINEWANPMLFILNNAEEAAYFATDLDRLLEKETFTLPESYRKSFQQETLDNTLVLKRAEALNQLQVNKNKIILITWPEAICERVIAPKILEKNTFQVKVNENFDLDFLMELLSEHDFERVDFVYEPGQFSIRGGIIDVFSFANDLPYRIVLDGDKVESIKLFTPEDQLSVKQVISVNIVPNIQQGSIVEERISIFEHLAPQTLIWIKDIAQFKESLHVGFEKALAGYKKLKDADLLDDTSNPILIFDSEENISNHLNQFSIIEFGARKNISTAIQFDFHTSPQPLFHKNFHLIVDHLKDNQSKKIANLIFSDTSKQIERLFTIFADMDKELVFEPIYKGLSEGFVDYQLNLAIYTEHQLFDRYYKYKGQKSYSGTQALTLKELRDLKPGDYVTHIDHGIGKFAGLEKIESNGIVTEAVRLVYKNNDLLYVHINSLHKITKYVGKDGTEPKLNKLGSDAWDKLKKSTKKKVKDIARDLIHLYAARKAQQGFAFAPDSYLQVELEASFLYEDTPDQSRATEDIKRDMEQSSPMDRLVCGDVGFGKTEVAIRAAFKAVCDSKQVAVLVPTTILAHQHYKTFRDRLKDLPVNVDYINRFRSAKEQKEILQKLKEGKIDIIIGTHKLVSDKTKFKDLGLLIIDEEQKFGVGVKEKLKQFRVNVDTLTLTATPIPRTLHFSLMGARDLSVINTPPPNRQPVKTEIHVFNKEKIKDAILYEVERGGQVYFIHHRVKDIYDIAQIIKNECPGVRVGVGHGQLNGEELEDVMVKFVEGEYDVLVATTIIESGLDIPNANTILINNAHMFGLSDLHQMRGRVGRSNKKAYCYLFSPPLSTLTPEAKKRLSAIEQFSDLGSGFNVAMRDLDIRGAGNLLGAEQSGFIAEIGFEMYHKILDEAIRELKDEEFKDLFADEEPSFLTKDCQIDVDVEILIPDYYVRNIQERLSLYNELSNINDEIKLRAFSSKVEDRFGKIPKELNRLFESVRLKWAGKSLGLEKISLKNNSLSLYFPLDQDSGYYQSDLFGKILQWIAANPSRASMKQTPKNLAATIKIVENIEQAIALLDRIKNFGLNEVASV